jgi:hypothetical protein
VKRIARRGKIESEAKWSCGGNNKKGVRDKLEEDDD